jgi:YkoY family integral membrane protein
MLDQLFSSAHFSSQSLLLLPVLIALEAVLSADNAIALAALTQGLKQPVQQNRALNIGLAMAYVLRMVLIVTATWVIQYWQVELAGALYLLWLVFQYFSSNDAEGDHHGPEFNSLWQAIPVIALTDLAFSLDSVTTAIAVSQETWLVLLGATIGIVALRFMAGLFIRWLQEFTHLEDAGYCTVALVGLKLLIKVFNDQLAPPEWVMVGLIAALFIWGFSKRRQEAPEGPEANELAPNSTETVLSGLLDPAQTLDHAEDEQRTPIRS